MPSTKSAVQQGTARGANRAGFDASYVDAQRWNDPVNWRGKKLAETGLHAAPAGSFTDVDGRMYPASERGQRAVGPVAPAIRAVTAPVRPEFQAAPLVMPAAVKLGLGGMSSGQISPISDPRAMPVGAGGASSGPAGGSASFTDSLAAIKRGDLSKFSGVRTGANGEQIATTGGADGRMHDDTRDSRILAAKAAGTFDATRTDYNRKNAGNLEMDAAGKIDLQAEKKKLVESFLADPVGTMKGYGTTPAAGASAAMGGGEREARPAEEISPIVAAPNKFEKEAAIPGPAGVFARGQMAGAKAAAAVKPVDMAKDYPLYKAPAAPMVPKASGPRASGSAAASALAAKNVQQFAADKQTRNEEATAAQRAGAYTQGASDFYSGKNPAMPANAALPIKQPSFDPLPAVEEESGISLPKMKRNVGVGINRPMARVAA